MMSVSDLHMKWYQLQTFWRNNRYCTVRAVAVTPIAKLLSRKDADLYHVSIYRGNQLVLMTKMNCQVPSPKQEPYPHQGLISKLNVSYVSVLEAGKVTESFCLFQVMIGRMLCGRRPKN